MSGQRSGDDFTAEGLFRAWTNLRAQTKQRRLGAKSAQKYSALWEAWLRFLASRSVSWRAAQPQDLADFVENMKSRRRAPAAAPPPQAAGSKPRPPQRAPVGPASVVSRNRYWRFVIAVYGHSEVFAWECGQHDFQNPLRDARAPETARTDQADSSVLAPHHWRALYDAKPLGKDWTVARDRAMLLLVLDTALTAGELADLTVHDVRDAGRRIHVAGSRPKQTPRELPLGEEAAQALNEWIEQRQALGAGNDVLFPSRKGLGRPTGRAVWHNLSVLVHQAMRACGDEHYHHAGPTVLRNAVLLRWLLAGTPVAEVARLAGLSSPRGLDRLIRLLDDVHRERISAQAKDAGAITTPEDPSP